MLEQFIALLENEVFVLFLVLGLGVLLGRIRIAGVELGSVTGVLFFGLLAGHFGYESSGGILGFILFIYCVGVQAGPDFLNAFKSDGSRYAALAVVVAASGILLVWGSSLVFGFDFGMPAGILGGALTSTPSLVAAQDAIQQGAPLPEGMTVADALDNVSSAYAITYVFGMAGLILLVSFMPRLLRVDVAAEAHEYGRDKVAPGTDFSLRSATVPTTRAYRVEKDEVIGMRRETMSDDDWRIPGTIERLKRGEEVLQPTDDTVLERGDIVSVVALESAHAWARQHIGPEVLDYDVMDRTTESRRVMIARPAIAGRTLEELDCTGTHNCMLTQVIRAGMTLPRRPDLELHLGDVLLLTGSGSALDALASEVGFEERRLQETDLLAFVFGIGLGILLGSFSIRLGGVALGLGTAGGVLVAGLIMGTLHARRPDVANLPAGARHVLMELGLLLFMVDVAVNAGETIVATFLASGWHLVLAGIAVTVLPALAAWVVGRYGFKMNGALLLGAITGAMTSTAALKQVQEQAQSQVPMLGYVGAYTFANVLLALAGALVVRI